jgi:hypothetical protein
MKITNCSSNSREDFSVGHWKQNERKEKNMNEGQKKNKSIKTTDKRKKLVKQEVKTNIERKRIV